MFIVLKKKIMINHYVYTDKHSTIKAGLKIYLKYLLNRRQQLFICML